MPFEYRSTLKTALACMSLSVLVVTGYGITVHGDVHLAWDASEDADVYYVQRAPTPGGPYATVSSALSSTSFVDESVEVGTTYYYVVVAANVHGASGPSNEVRFTAGSLFVRGDANSDGVLDVSDAAAMVSCLFGGNSCPACLDAADCNDDGGVDVSDAICVLACLFHAADCLPDCEIDATSDLLDCAEPPGCR